MKEAVVRPREEDKKAARLFSAIGRGQSLPESAQKKKTQLLGDSGSRRKVANIMRAASRGTWEGNRRFNVLGL